VEKGGAPIEAVEQLARRLWRAEVRLAESRRAIAESTRRLDAIQRSTSWRVTAPLRRFSDHDPGSARLLRRAAKVAWWTASLQLRQRLRQRRVALAEAERAAGATAPASYARWVAEHDTLDASDLAGMAALYDSLDRPPLVSVLVPVFDPPEDALREAIESVRAQAYANWELCLADDASAAPHVATVLHEYAALDPRIRVVRRAHNGGISEASNSALELARGALVALLDHDDLLRPHSLLLSVLPFLEDSRVGFVYSDADRVDVDGRRISHYFKPDWSPTLLLCQNYLCHLSVIRTDLVRAVGGFRKRFDGSQDWDLALRVTERIPREGVVHVPHVLYHWRAIAGSVASEGLAAKPYAADAARRAVEEHLARIGRPGFVLPVGDHQKVRFFVGSPPPPVSIVVPSTGRRDLLEPCLDGLLHRTAYEPLEVVVAVDVSAYEDTATRDFLSQLSSRPHVRVVSYPSRPFNYALTVNEAVAETTSPFVLLLNDDTEVVYDDWLEAMVGYAQDERVGAVGGQLVYPDGTIHSAGMLLGARTIAENRYHRRPELTRGYGNRAQLPQDLSAVVGTSMLVRRTAFDEVGGLDTSFPVAYNDVDFCLKLRRAGWRVLYVPDGILLHQGSASFETHQLGREAGHENDTDRMTRRWRDALRDDPTHNPNLALDAAYPSRLASPPRVEYPWRLSAAVRRNVA
jgi:GT2 family glycosyltransferase